MINFLYHGGQSKVMERGGSPGNSRNISINFYVFLVHENKEIILYEALRKGYVSDTGEKVEVTRVTDNVVHSVRASKFRIMDGITNPHLKVFTSLSGFGVQKRYMSKYVMLSSNSMSTVQIMNLPPIIPQTSAKFIFEAQGELLSDQKVMALLQNEPQAISFYNQQASLGVSTLNSIIKTGISTEVMKQKRIRRIRL